MNKHARVKVLPKSEQTVEYAEQVLSNPYSNQHLADISKKLWTPELVELAVRMGKAPLTVLPEADRTEELCLLACRRDTSQIENIPMQLRTHQFFLQVVSQKPRTYASISFMERTEYEAENSAPYNQSYEAVELALAAICPIAYGEKVIACQIKDVDLHGDARKDYISQNYGLCENYIPRDLLRRALALLLEKRTNENTWKKRMSPCGKPCGCQRLLAATRFLFIGHNSSVA